MHVYPVPPRAASSITDEGEVPGDGPLMVAMRAADLVSPAGRPLGEHDRSALAAGGTARIHTGELVVFCKVVAVAPALVRRDGRVQAQGSPAEHATLGPLEELQAIVLRAAWQEHEDRDWRAVVIGQDRPLKAGSLDGTLTRVPDTPANRAMFGSVGTSDGSSPFPQVRALPLNDVCTRSLLGMPHGPAGTDKAAAEQKLLDAAMEQYPHLFAPDRIWIMDRLYHGAPRIARLTARTHVLIRLKSDIPLKRISPVLKDGSYLAELSGDGACVTVRVIEYWVTVEGQEVPEMFCLVTDLLDWREYPAPELAALCKWRWDGSETGLREAKASLHGAGPGTGPMLRSGRPELVRQELAAWAAATEMTRGVTRDAALAAAPARKGRRAGQPVRPRDLSHARARRVVLAAIRAGRTCYQALTREIGKYRNAADRSRHRARKSKSPVPSRTRPRRTPSPASPRPSSPWPTPQPDQRKH